MNSNILRWLEAILFDRYGINFTLVEVNSTIKLSYSASAGNIVFDQLNSDFLVAGRKLSFEVWNSEAEGWSSVMNLPIPMPGVLFVKGDLIEKLDEDYLIHYDILGLAYWMLTRVEEIGCSDLDVHGRFQASSSHAYKYGYLNRPIVDEWLEVLGQVIERQWREVTLKRREFSVKVSHDVDLPSRYGFKTWPRLVRIIAGDILRRRDFNALAAPLIKLKTKNKMWSRDPYNTMTKIMDLSDKYNIKSAFYFISGCTDVTKDSDYTLDHPAIQSLMLEIDSRNHEIGIHPSYGASLDSAAFFSEVDNLKETMVSLGIRVKKIGGRMHYLRFTAPETFRLWGDSAFLEYDSSLGYADHSGFRAGTAVPYIYFDPIKKCQIDITIQPLIAMEVSVTSPSYQNLGLGELALKQFLELKNTCRKVGGDFTLLWHNSNMVDNESFELYEAVLRG